MLDRSPARGHTGHGRRGAYPAQVRRGSLLAVATSALLGVASGVVGGLVVDHNAVQGPDPLGLGVSQVNQPCTGKTLLVVARGDTAAELGSTVATEGKGTRYLATGASCDTAWFGDGRKAPKYAAYLGPYSSPSQACPQRMTVAHRGSVVVRLVSGTPEPVQCLCYVSFASMPQLRTGQEVTESTQIYVRALQHMLTDLRLNPAAHQNGLYDLRTVSAVRELQHDNAIPTTGVVDRQTWQVLIRHGCNGHST